MHRPCPRYEGVRTSIEAVLTMMEMHMTSREASSRTSRDRSSRRSSHPTTRRA
jgi:hypothetical protein